MGFPFRIITLHHELPTLPIDYGEDDMKLLAFRKLAISSFLVVSLFILLGCGAFTSIFPPKVTATPAATPTRTPIPEPTLAPIPTSSLTGADVVTLKPICHTSMDGLSILKKDLKIPEHFSSNPLRQDSDFDVNQYFSVLTHLSMAPGYTLDYLYLSSGMGGRPQVYARKSADAQFKIIDEYQKFIEAQKASEGAYTPVFPDSDYLSKVKVDGSPEGYFQFVVLALLDNQFYLGWHANYNDTRVICDSSDLKRIDEELGFFKMKLPENVVEGTKQIEFVPGVLIGSDTVTIRVVTFSKWGGFKEHIFTLDKHAPYKAVDVKHIELIKYQVGIAF
jgi:hypothetical protein